jgi:hypothetical protein
MAKIAMRCNGSNGYLVKSMCRHYDTEVQVRKRRRLATPPFSFAE